MSDETKKTDWNGDLIRICLLSSAVDAFGERAMARRELLSAEWSFEKQSVDVRKIAAFDSFEVGREEINSLVVDAVPPVSPMLVSVSLLIAFAVVVGLWATYLFWGILLRLRQTFWGTSKTEVNVTQNAGGK